MEIIRVDIGICLEEFEEVFDLLKEKETDFLCVYDVELMDAGDPDYSHFDFIFKVDNPKNVTAAQLEELARKELAAINDALNIKLYTYDAYSILRVMDKQGIVSLVLAIDTERLSELVIISEREKDLAAILLLVAGSQHPKTVRSPLLAV